MSARKLSPHKQQMLTSVTLDPEALMESGLICAHFGGKSKMTFSRWRKHPDPARRFPPPDLFIGPIPYWRRRTVLGFVDAQGRRGTYNKTKEQSDLAVAGRQKARAAERSCNKPTGAPPPQATGDVGVP
jgi:hypothetical protein